MNGYEPEETLSMKKRDFMVMYELLPELVEKAWSAIEVDYSNHK